MVHRGKEAEQGPATLNESINVIL